MEVEFGLMKWKDKGKTKINAKGVTQKGGGSVAIQDEQDAKKEFVGSMTSRYSGKLKFFSPLNGFGYITIAKDQGIPSEVPKELRVETAEVNGGGSRPKMMRDVDVEFGIWITKKGKHRAHNMTFPGGEPILQETVEHRSEETDGEEFKGKVQMWHRKFGWGLILPEKGAKLPEKVNKAINKMNKDTKKRGKEVQHKFALYFRRKDLQGGYFPQQDDKVVFQVYTDDKGAGAFAIHK